MKMRLLKDVQGLGKKGDVIEVGGDDRVARYRDRGIAEPSHDAERHVPVESNPPLRTVTHKQVRRAKQRR